MIEKGLLYLPESTEHPGQARTWIQPFLSEICSFPLGRHDDYVDALTQALRYLRDANIIVIDHFAQQSNDYIDDDYNKRAENPYAV